MTEDLFHDEQQVTMSFADHIGELRECLIRALLGLVLGTFACLFIAVPVTRLIEAPAKRELGLYYGKLRQNQIDQATRAARTNPASDKLASLRLTVNGSALATWARRALPGARIHPPPDAGRRRFALQARASRRTIEAATLPQVVPEASLITLSAMEALVIYLKVAVVTGLIATSPWVFYQLWIFVAAGLYPHERRYVYLFMPFSLGLFLAGVALCYFGVLPFALKFLLWFGQFLNVRPTIRLSEWMHFACILPVLFGASFQMPLIMLFLDRIGITDLSVYTHYRRHAIVVLFILAALITPGESDLLSMISLAVPMCLLYELGIILTRHVNRRRRREPIPALEPAWPGPPRNP